LVILIGIFWDLNFYGGAGRGYGGGERIRLSDD